MGDGDEEYDPFEMDERVDFDELVLKEEDDFDLGNSSSTVRSTISIEDYDNQYSEGSYQDTGNYNKSDNDGVNCNVMLKINQNCLDSDFKPSELVIEKLQIETSESKQVSATCTSYANLSKKRKTEELEKSSDGAESSVSKLTTPSSEAAGRSVKNISSTPTSMHEKWLWKSGWVYVRKYLKPYLQSGHISSETAMDRLSKKLAQKVYQKELVKGTAEINAENSRRIKKYVESFFLKYKRYDDNSLV